MGLNFELLVKGEALCCCTVGGSYSCTGWGQSRHRRKRK